MEGRVSGKSYSNRVIREALWLALATFIAAALVWTFRTPRFPLIAEISDYILDLDYTVLPVDVCIENFEAGSHLFIDTRGEAEAGEYIPGAFFIGNESFEDDLREVFDFLYPEDPLILYGDGRLQVTAAVAARFEARGYKVAGLMRGGIDAWRAAGGEVSGGEEAP